MVGPDDGSIRRGNRVRITAGTFEGFEAVVTDFDLPARKVFAEIHIFGKVTPIEVDLADAERIPWRPTRDPGS